MNSYDAVETLSQSNNFICPLFSGNAPGDLEMQWASDREKA